MKEKVKQCVDNQKDATRDSDTESDEENTILDQAKWKDCIAKIRKKERQKRQEDRGKEVSRICIFVHRELSTLRTGVQRAREIADFLDCAVLAIEYPGYSATGRDWGSKCTTGALVKAVRTLVEFLNVKRGVPFERIILCGESCGAGIVTLVAQEFPQLGGLLVINAFPSVRDYLSKLLLPYEARVKPWLSKLLPGTEKIFSYISVVLSSPFYCERMPVKQILETIRVPFLALTATDLHTPPKPDQAKLLQSFANQMNKLKSSASSLQGGGGQFMQTLVWNGDVQYPGSMYPVYLPPAIEHHHDTERLGDAEQSCSCNSTFYFSGSPPGELFCGVIEIRDVPAGVDNHD